MANYTRKDLSDVLMDYLALKIRQSEGLNARAAAAVTPVASAMVFGDIAATVVKLGTAASIIVDLNADKLAVELSSDLLNDLKRVMGYTEGDGL